MPTRRLDYNGTGDISGVYRLDAPFSLKFCRVSFIGGTGSDEMVITAAPGRPSDIARVLIKVQGVGAGGDSVDVRVPENQLGAFAITRGDYSVADGLGVEWTNPDPGVTKWAMELGLEWEDA